MFFFVILAAVGFGYATDDAVYPDFHWELTRWKAFQMTAGFLLVMFALPPLFACFLLVASSIQIRKSKPLVKLVV